MTQYPVSVGDQFTLKFGIGGKQVIEVVTPERTGFIGRNVATGKQVKIRSYRMVPGLQDYTPPPEPPKIVPTIGEMYTVTSGRGVKTVQCQSVEGTEFTDVTGKVWPMGRIVGEGVCQKVKTPVTRSPARRSGFGKREIVFVRDGKEYSVQWDESFARLRDQTGTELYRCPMLGNIFHAIEEL